MDALSYSNAELWQYLQHLVDHGVTSISAAIFMLLEANGQGNVIPSPYATAARELGLDIIAWSFERSDALSNSHSSWYYSKFSEVLRSDSDMLKVLDVLYEDVGVKAIVTDWPSVVTFYANCKGI
jgi:glycerophosphoryl diester phosphodiesterase